MKKLLIITLLSTSCLALKAMQQERVPKLQDRIKQYFMNEIAQGPLDLQELSKALQDSGLSESTTGLDINKMFIDSFNQKTPISKNNTPEGSITRFADGSMRIDNYLGMGETIFLSADLESYLHLDPEGKTIVTAAEKEHSKSTTATHYFEYPSDYYTLPQGIEIQRSQYIKDADGDRVQGPFLMISYPQDFKVSFKSGSSRITVDSPIREALLPLHKAIANLDKTQVTKIIQVLIRNNQLHILDTLFITDNALQRAIKKALTATGQQLEDAKSIIQMLIQLEANLALKNSEGKSALQLAAPNADIKATIEEASIRKSLLDTIKGANKNIVGQFIAVLNKQGYQGDTLSTFLNTNNYGVDTPLIFTFKRALATNNNQEFQNYIAIAQLLLDNGATLNNASAKSFMERYGKQYVQKIAPVIDKIASV